MCDFVGTGDDLADLSRLFTSPTVSLLSSRTRLKSMSQLMSMSSSSLQRDLVALFELSSRKVVELTPPSPSSKMSLARPKRRPSDSVSVSGLDTYTRQLSKRRSTLIFTVNVVA